MENDNNNESPSELPARAAVEEPVQSISMPVWSLTIGYLVLAGITLILTGSSAIIFVPFLTACLITTFYLFYLALMPVPESLRRKNPDDNMLAGSKVMLTPQGAFRALCPALVRMVGLHYFLTVLPILFINGYHFFSYSNDNDNSLLENEVPMLLIFLNSCPIAALFMGAMLATSLWVLSKSRFERAFVIASLIFGWLVQYWIIFYVIVKALHTFDTSIFSVVLVLSLILPGLIVSKAWRRAERKLDEVAAGHTNVMKDDGHVPGL